jgi:hypothetical protein
MGSFSEWLPVVDFGGSESLVDIERREFRHVDKPESAVSFYSEQGRRMIRAMAGMQWWRFRVNNLQKVKCPECGGLSWDTRRD